MSKLVAPVLVLPLLVSACGSVAAGVCQRADECNTLGTGVSVTQCTENFERDLDNMTASVRADCEKDLSDALSNASCEAFIVDFLQACQTAGGGGGGNDTF